MRENADIKGIIIDETEIKLSVYANDESLLVTDVQSFQINIFICNQRILIMKARLEKAEEYWIGKGEGKAEKPTDSNFINLCNLTKSKYHVFIIVTTKV